MSNFQKAFELARSHGDDEDMRYLNALTAKHVDADVVTTDAERAEEEKAKRAADYWAIPAAPGLNSPD